MQKQQLSITDLIVTPLAFADSVFE